MQRKAFTERPDDGSLLDIYGCGPAAAKTTNTTFKMCTCKYCGCIAHRCLKKKHDQLYLNYSLFYSIWGNNN